MVRTGTTFYTLLSVVPWAFRTNFVMVINYNGDDLNCSILTFLLFAGNTKEFPSSIQNVCKVI